MGVEVSGWFRNGARPRRAGRAFGFLLCAAVAVASCAVPGHLYRVSPPIMGTIQVIDSGTRDVELVLNVMHRESPALFDVQRVPLSEDGSFYFEPVALKIAGHEFSKFYRVFLHYRDGAQDLVIWRGEYSRRDLVGRIQLDCKLDRLSRVSQPCIVRDPLKHPWLVAEGERTFRRLCAGCHEGQESAGTAGSAMAPDLSRIAARRGGEFDRTEIAEWIEGSATPRDHGSRTMPVWGERLSAEYWRYPNADELAGATLDPILAYLESLQQE